MACPGVQGGWSQALTCAVGCWPVISSPREKKGTAFSCFLSALWGSLPYNHPILGYDCDLHQTPGLSPMQKVGA